MGGAILMADQTGELIEFIWARHPELDYEDITKVVSSVGEWIDQQMAKEGS
jgi:hypothetical protein